MKLFMQLITIIASELSNLMLLEDKKEKQVSTQQRVWCEPWEKVI